MSKLLFSVLCLMTFGNSGLAASRYHVVKTFPLKGDTGWDYLTFDPAAKRLYVTRATHVTVLDGESGAELGEIPGTEGVHGVALAPDLGKGFTSNGRAASVTAFDLKTLQVLGTIPTGKHPDAIVYEPKSKRVLAMNGESRSATVIDAAGLKALGSIDLGGRPESATTDGEGKVFVNLEDKNQIAALDPVKLAKLATWNVGPCDEPTGLAMDPMHHRLFAGCHNETLVVVNSQTGKVVAKLPIGKGVDANAFDPGTGLVFSSNGEGTLTVIHEDSPDTYSLVETAATQKSARTMALNPTTHQVYVIAARFGAPLPGARRKRPPMIPGSAVVLMLER